jgi:hypothetical protein
VLYLELDVTQHKNHILVKFLHALSLGGSYCVAVLVTLLIFVLNPDFIADRAKAHLFGDVTISWLATVWCVCVCVCVVIGSKLFCVPVCVQCRFHVCCPRPHRLTHTHTHSYALHVSVGCTMFRL